MILQSQPDKGDALDHLQDVTHDLEDAGGVCGSFVCENANEGSDTVACLEQPQRHYLGITETDRKVGADNKSTAGMVRNCLPRGLQLEFSSTSA